MTTNLFLASCCALTFTGCVLDPGEPVDSTGTFEIVNDNTDPTRPTTPAPALPPPEGPNVARIPSSELDAALRFFLAGPLITIDTTGTSAARLGSPYTECVDVNQTTREEEQDGCFRDFFGYGLNICLQRALADYPVQMECHTTARTFHSYIDFLPLAEQRGAKDVLFGVQPVYVEGWTSLHRVDINYLRSDLDRPITAGFTTNKTASISLPLTSNSPTLIVEDSPNVEMSNMRVQLRLTDLNPGPDYSCAAGGTAPACTGGSGNLVSARFTHSTPRPIFSFTRNINNVPDWLVDQFVDVDAAIKDAAEGRLQDALLAPTAKAALDQVLTELAINHVRNTTHPGIRGFQRIKNTWYVSGQLVVEYDWY